MSFLMKAPRDLAGDRITLGGIAADLFDLAALASGLAAALRPEDDEQDDEAGIRAQRLARLVPESVERAALALGHVQRDVSDAPLDAIRAVPNPHPLLRLIPANICAGMMLTAEEAAGLEALRALLGGKAVQQ